MDVCPTSFKSRLPLLPSFWPFQSDWQYVDPALTITLDWDEAMEEGVEPLASDFVLVVDGVDKTPDSFTWVSGLESTLIYSEAILGPTVVRLRYPTSSVNFISVAGEIVTPFDILVDAP